MKKSIRQSSAVRIQNDPEGDAMVARVNFHLYDGSRGAVVSNIFDNYFKVESFFFGLGEVFLGELRTCFVDSL
ncbi:MAG: hypothetical protein JF609_01275 [Verrucomicrobia bacterium]|nr:hypothetical protein [Verrucomicrobiota bacterium]